MIIYYSDEDAVSCEVRGLMEKAASLCLEEEGIGEVPAELSVTFCGKDEIRQLNSDYRGIDKVTDVLSFPQFESAEEIAEAAGPIFDDETVPVGDVVICTQVAGEQASEYGHSVERELVYLFTHSVFHLLGYDHITDDDKTIMRNKEEKIMKEVGLDR